MAEKLDFYAGLIYERIFGAPWAHATPSIKEDCFQAAKTVLEAYEMDRLTN